MIWFRPDKYLQFGKTWTIGNDAFFNVIFLCLINIKIKADNSSPGGYLVPIVTLNYFCEFKIKEMV